MLTVCADGQVSMSISAYLCVLRLSTAENSSSPQTHTDCSFFARIGNDTEYADIKEDHEDTRMRELSMMRSEHASATMLTRGIAMSVSVSRRHFVVRHDELQRRRKGFGYSGHLCGGSVV